MKAKKGHLFQMYFYSLFIKITFFITLTVLALTAFLYVNFKNYSVELLNASNEKMMRQIFHNAMQVNSYVKSYTTALFNNPDASQLMYGEELTILDTLNSMKSLEITLGSAPFIYSAYVYNGRSNTYYSVGSNPLIRKDSFFDQEIVRMFHSPEQLPALSPIPRKVPVSNMNPDHYVNAYTYVIPEFFSGGKQLKNALVINVKMDWIFNTLTSFRETNSLEGDNILILDRQGDVIAHSDQNWFLKNLSGESYMNKIKASVKKSGVLTADVDGTPSVVTYVSYESPEWMLVNITPYEVIAGTVDKVKYIALSIGLSMLAICLFTAYLLSKNLYSPVRSLRKTIGQMSEGHSLKESHVSEFEFITGSFQSAHQKLALLESFKKSNIYRLKQQILNDMLSNNMFKRQNVDQLFKDCNIRIDPRSGIAVILFKVDNYAAFRANYDENDQSLLKYAFINIADEIMLLSFRCDSVDTGSDHIITVLNVEAGWELQQFTPFIQEIQSAYRKYCSFSVSAFISKPSEDIKNVRKLYESALELSNYRIKYGHSCILSQPEMESRALSHYNIDDEAIAQLLDALRRGKLEELEHEYREIISALRDCQYNNIMFTLSYLSSSIFNTLNLMEKNGTKSFELDFVSFDWTIKSLETFEQIDSEFMELFRTVADRIQQNRDDKSGIIVSGAMTYIELNYMDKTLSSNSVAEKMKLTPAYLGKLFRDYASQSVSDYIAHVRFSKAAELLKDSQLSIDEIIDKIGWENKKYFFTLFKKRFGTTPSEYRLKANVKEIEQ